jgi:hypothetical protein
MGPGPNGEPEDGDWQNLAGEFANVATESLLATFVSTGLPAQLVAVDGLPSLHFVPPAASSLTGPAIPIAGGATFFCCGGSTSKDVAVSTTLTPQPQVWALFVSFADANLRWNIGSGSNAKTLDLSTSGVTITGNLTTSSGNVISGTQQLKLAGTLLYTLTNGEKKTSPLNATFSYTTYPTGQPTGTGQMGPSTLNGSISGPPANRCTKVPREGCGPCTAGNCGPAPCGLWPACPT